MRRSQQQDEDEQQAQRLRVVNDQSKAELLRLKKEEERLNRQKKDAVDVGKPLKAKIVRPFSGVACMPLTPASRRRSWPRRST